MLEYCLWVRSALWVTRSMSVCQGQVVLERELGMCMATLHYTPAGSLLLHVYVFTRHLITVMQQAIALYSV